MSPIQVVTLADREPWSSMALDMEKVIRSLGLGFHCETTAHGERPWQAKRFALREAFNQNSSRTYWIDADYILTDPEMAARFLVDRRPGLHCSRLNPGANNNPIKSVRDWGTRPNQAGADRNEEIYRACLAENGLASSTHFGGSIVGYFIEPGVGLELCSIWDSIAHKLQENSTTWTEEISIGIAADALKIPIIPDLGNFKEQGFQHLRLGYSNGYFLSTPLPINQGT
jgi:hypothetical protein